MHNLINFFVKNSSWFVFIFYVIISCAMLFQYNPYQQSVYLSSANDVSATVYNGISNFTSYFYLRDINSDLQERNASLEMEVVNLRNQVNDLKMQVPDSNALQPAIRNYSFVVARVISNSVTQPHNYITINRGSAEGVKPEMGVVDQNGVVGIVNVVGRHSSRVISLLNPYMRLSCKVRGTNYFGSLVWNGESPYYAVLEEMPRHVKFKRGDQIVTSGYSSVFPEGIVVGKIVGMVKELNDNFFSLKIQLSTDFTQLSTVRAIGNNMRPELQALEQSDKGIKEDNQ
ncbi:MAG: rod shape-determining protein MreC [Muribaculaceae bacterium]|nr:rod shape-determining protein MreC [Muribaculaceae bacterium]